MEVLHINVRLLLFVVHKVVDLLVLLLGPVLTGIDLCINVKMIVHLLVELDGVAFQ